MLAVINGSPHRDGHTYRALKAVADMLCRENGLEQIWVNLDNDLRGCIDCGNCVARCMIKDQFQSIVNVIENSSMVLIGTPVYLDMPTTQTVALLTRLNCMAEPTKRTFLRGKSVHLLAVGYCSGTKTAIHTMMGACEMLGFDIAGRSTWEHCAIWKDNKVRGGNPGQACWME